MAKYGPPPPLPEWENADMGEPWDSMKLRHPQYVDSHYFRCEVCNEPFSEHAAGRVTWKQCICGDCIREAPNDR